MKLRAFFTLFFVASAILFAQVIQTGTIRGFVTDPSAASVPKAGVTVVSDTKLVTRTAVTGADGGFLFLSLPRGTYDVTVEATGFSKYVQRGIQLSSGYDLRIDVPLKPGAVTTAVEVTADAVPPVNTVNANVNHVISTQEIMAYLLPANDVVRMAAFLPGAANEYSHNGQGGNQNVIVVDGTNDGDEFVSGGGWKFHPPADAVSEFRVTQNGYSTEYGRASASRIEMVTKSGTNDYHGSVYWYHRNKNFNAKSWNSTSKSLKRYNEEGYTLGGPVKKEKVYFFWTNYFRRNLTPQAGYRTWPTQAQYGGDFSAWLNPGGTLKARTVRDPVTKTPFANNVIPKTQLNKNALAYLDLFYPLVSNPMALVNNDYTADGQTDNDDYYAPRLDYRVTDKLNMYARYMYNRRVQIFANAAPQKEHNPDQLRLPGRIHSFAIAGTYLATPRGLIDFQGNFMRTDGSWQMREPESALIARIPGWSAKLLYPQGNVLGQLPQMNMSGSGYTSIGRATGRANKWAQANAGANYAWQGSRHNIKFGFEEVYRTNIQTGVSGTFGNYSYDSSATGDSLADLMLGRARTFYQNSNMTYWRAGAWQHGWFAQDEVKLAKTFTLTFGVRWESDGAYKAIRGQKWSNWRPEYFDVTKGHGVNPSTGILTGTVNNLNGIEIVDVVGGAPKKNFAPRVAIAYAPWGAKTAIRAGYGVFFDHQQGPTSRLPGNPPFRYGATLYDVLLDDPTGGSPDAVRTSGLSSVTVPFTTPRTHKYSFSFQQEVAGMLAEVSYIGNRSSHQVVSTDVNLPKPNADVLAKRAHIDSVRPYYGFGSISRTMWGANGRYNSLQMQLKRSMKNGLLMQASFTLQKNTVDGGGTLWYDRSYDAGQISQHGIFSLAAAYQIPKVSDGPAALKLIVNGWQLSSEARWLSGSPLSVSLSTDTTGTGRAYRANWTGSVNQNRTMASWFDTAAFSASSPLQIGNSPVGAVWGPGSWNIDGGVFRDFKIRERFTLQYRFEAYNALNHFNYNNPNTAFGQPTFGRITAKGGSARNLQMGLRLTF
jgi:hypothetical protein